MSSSSYKKFAHLQIPLKDIASATSNFSDANIIKISTFGKAYKGQLFQSQQLIDITAERLDRAHHQGDDEFWKEISMLSSLKHENLVSMVGFCNEGDENIIINKLEVNGSLDKFLGDMNLTWMQRLRICVGVAHALNNIYYDEGRDFSIIHRNIMSSNVLLDEHWEPKLCGFELSLNQTAARRDRVFVAEFCGTPEYSDPTYLKEGIVTHKSDIYSFGVLLFEILSGKEARMVDKKDMSLGLLARSRYESGTLDDMVDPGLRKQMDPESFKIFSDIAYYCLTEQPLQRPTIDQIVIKLEKALEYQQKLENPDAFLKHLRIPLTDIEKATENFADKYLIGSGAYGMVYKAILDHFDSNNLFPLEEKITKCEIPKIRSTVAIKRIMIREDNQGENGFLAEIEMLSRCKHPNIVSLLGFCSEGRHMILVYEYASKRSLDDYLKSTGNMLTLTWMERIRICIDAACGLRYLHNKIEDGRTIIHHDLKSGNILLQDNLEAKIGDFGLSRLLPENQVKTIYSEHIKGTPVYWCPEYESTGKLSNKIDIYSFGVILFEMLSGRFANDQLYTKENSYGIAHVGRRHFIEGTINDMVDTRLMEETHENILTLKKGPDQDSLNAFSKIAYQCVGKTQDERPTVEVIIKTLEEALYLQENSKDNFKIPLSDIILATQNFSANNVIGEGKLGTVYKGEIHGNTIAAKRLHEGLGKQQFLKEMQIVLEFKHENITSVIGYCKEMGEIIIVYEYGSRGRLDSHLKDSGLTWINRLKICIDIASGLDFHHGNALKQVVIHDMKRKSSNILLDDDWKAKITDFGHTHRTPFYKNWSYSIRRNSSYIDPMIGSLFETIAYNIYWLGEVLLEILCGRSVIAYNDHDQSQSLTNLFKRHYIKGTVDEMVFEGIKEQIVPKSLSKFQRIVYQCLTQKTQKTDGQQTTRAVLLQLKEALQIQMENTSATTNRVIPPTMDELVPPVGQNVHVLPHNHEEEQEKFIGLNFKKYSTEDVHVVARFLNYKMVESKTIIDQVQEFQVIMNDMHAEGTTLGKTFQVVSIIEKLPQGWSDFKNYLKSKQKEMSVEDLIMQLRIEEDNRLAKPKG